MYLKYLGFVLLLLFTGCATKSTTNIEAFANATKGVSQKVDKVITQYNESIVNDKLVELALSKRRITDEKFEVIGKALINTSKKKDIALYRANQALGSYASSLQELSKAGSKDSIDLASAKLYGSLVSFNKQYKTLANTNKNLVEEKTLSSIASAIAQLGSIYVERKKSKAIKSIVLQADTHVQKICDIMIEQFLKGVIEGRLYTMKHNELTALLSDYNNIVQKASYSKKRYELNEIYKKYLEMQTSNANVKLAIKALTQVKKAHLLLKKQLQEDKFSSEALIKAIGELKNLNNEYNDLQTLMLSCETKLVIDPNKGIVCK